MTSLLGQFSPVDSLLVVNETVSLGDTAVSLHTLIPTMLRGRGVILGYSKLKVPSPDQIFIFGQGGGADISNSGSPCIADSLSHTLCVWRLTKCQLSLATFD